MDTENPSETLVATDGPTSKSPVPRNSGGGINGETHPNGDVRISMKNEIESGLEERTAELEAELERTREERDNYAAQYKTLLSRIQTMKSTLGNKLKEDAEELDRREQTINALNQQNEDLQLTLQTLQTELVACNDESEQLTKELDRTRTRILEFEDTSRESVIRDRELRELREEAERLRLDKEDLERTIQQEHLSAENNEEIISSLRKELETTQLIRTRAEQTLADESERSQNLQGVLEDFQASKDAELENAVREIQTQLDSVTLSLAEYKHRALQAELELESRVSSADRIEKLEAEVKEKSVLLGKLRHQSVILNEHLTEALRRLHRNSSENNVDRRLVTNILLSFLSTPRGDTKRFEMLSILSTILGWTDDDRERAGLQRNLYGGLSSPTRKKLSLQDGSVPKANSTDDSSESFSNMWVEFLMKEAAQGQGAPFVHTRRPSTSGHSDSGGLSMLSPRSDISPTSVYGKRVASLGSLSAVDLSRPTARKSGQEEKPERRLL